MDQSNQSWMRVVHDGIVMVFAVFVLGWPSGSCDGAVVNLNFAAPSLDRWNYPFASSPGGGSYAAVFSPLTTTGFDPSFDNRDGQMLVGFNTANPPSGAGVPANLALGRYRVLSASVQVTVESSSTFRYDTSPDSYRNWLLPGDPEFLPDPDTGHAVELFGTGFRNGETAVTHLENDPYSTGGSFGQGIRSAYPIAFHDGDCVDASNNVDLRFDPTPFAVGLNGSLAPGQLVPVDTPLTFAINVNDPDIQRWLRRALREGMVDFSIASIFPSEQQTTGTYPRFYSKENLAVLLGLVSAARLQMSVEVLDTPASVADITGDGVVNVADLLEVIGAWGPCACCAADLDGNGAVNVSDLLSLIGSWGPVV